MAKDFDKLSEHELEDVIASAEKVLRAKKESKRKKVMSQIRELATSIGVSVEIRDIRKGSTRKGTKVAPKYENPDNLSQKWSGRGMKPKWLKTLVEEGHDLDEFRIK